MEGYSKMPEFGFEIWAALDDYSRYVLWANVDVASRTPVSVYRRHLDAVASAEHVPQILRTNLAETSLVANANWALRRASNPEIAQNECCPGRNPGHNRLEMWWGQLSKSCLFLRRVSLSVVLCCSSCLP